MAYFEELDTFTAAAAADLSAKRYHIMRLSAAQTVNQASLATDSGICGVLQNEPQSGETATIAYEGITKVVAGGSVTVNAFITSNSSGRATAVGSGGMAIGRALQAAGNDGEVITAVIFHPVRWSGAA